MAKLTLAVDFDDTISTNDRWPFPGPPKAGVAQALSALQDKYYIIIYSCRFNAQTGDKAFHTKAIQNFMQKHKIPYDEIDLGQQGKVFADFYIDDKAIAFEDNWGEITEALTKAMD